MNTPICHSKDADCRGGFSDVRLVHVVRQYAPNVGGLEDVVKNLAAQQAGRFAGLKVITLNRLFQEPDRVLPEKEMIDGVEVHRIPFSGSSRYPIAPSVLSEIRDADLVHVHAVDFFFDALALSKIWHGKKMVATTHGGFFHTKKFAALKAVWFNTLTRFSASRYAGLACCSQSDLELFRRIAPGRVRLIENGADIEKFHNAASPGPQKRLLALGRFSENKRLDRLIDLMADLTAEDPEWRLEIAGMESDISAGDLEARVEALALSDSVTVHVGLNLEALRSLIGTCSFFVSASDYEGFGLVLIEALSAGLVPVVQQNEAFVALSRELDVVRLADFDNRRQTLETIVAAYSDLSAEPDLKDRAVNSVERFGWPLVARAYDDLYREALSR
ncbi:glycosyltransferase family 4 protein [Roseibium aggregatum]|uniref:Glycosyltransferase family 4 protein n=1 Tax=Roseibium aggregatum TaxID=187304 RepID=A0A939J006_9HYPH|nr:glycosyltransferase family 4 protein [Roseibium aggregatum]MBN9668758.1 glycosyltransferase family 4 protein [Roseibium aggregatum]